jgi:hypothetical protein
MTALDRGDVSLKAELASLRKAAQTELLEAHRRVRRLEAALTEIAQDIRYMAAWDIAHAALDTTQDRKGEPT